MAEVREGCWHTRRVQASSRGRRRQATRAPLTVGRVPGSGVHRLHVANANDGAFALRAGWSGAALWKVQGGARATWQGDVAAEAGGQRAGVQQHLYFKCFTSG